MTIFVGLTGGIATGKSTIVEFLKKNGYKVHDSDLAVNKMYSQPTKQLLSTLKKIGLSRSIKNKQINKKVIRTKELNLLNPLIVIFFIKITLLTIKYPRNINENNKTNDKSFDGRISNLKLISTKETISPAAIGLGIPIKKPSFSSCASVLNRASLKATQIV